MAYFSRRICYFFNPSTIRILFVKPIGKKRCVVCNARWDYVASAKYAPSVLLQKYSVFGCGLKRLFCALISLCSSLKQ